MPTNVERWSGSGFVARIVVLALTGIAWSASSLHHALFQPAYWDPITVGDYFAVYAYTLAWLLTTASLLILREVASAGEAGAANSMIPTAILVVAAGCGVAGVANALEDGVGISGFGIVYVLGAVVGGFGLLAIAAMLFASPLRILTFVPAVGALAIMTIMGGGGVLALIAWGGFAVVLIRERRRSSRSTAVEGIAPRRLLR